MIKSITTTIFLFIISLSTLAGDRNETIKELMQAQGLLSMFEQQIDMGKVQSEKMGNQMMDQMMSQLNPAPEFKKRFSSAYRNFINKLSDIHTAKEIVDVWAKYYGAEFSDKELQNLLGFYTSEIGQKEVKASKKALVLFTDHFQKVNQPIVQQATQEYISELKIIAKDCNCAK